jgi:hypothetical protein
MRAKPLAVSRRPPSLAEGAIKDFPETSEKVLPGTSSGMTGKKRSKKFLNFFQSCPITPSTPVRRQGRKPLEAASRS